MYSNVLVKLLQLSCMEVLDSDYDKREQDDAEDIDSLETPLPLDG